MSRWVLKTALVVVLALLALPAGSTVLVYFDEQGFGLNSRGLYNFDTETGISTLRTTVSGSERFFGWDVRRSDRVVFAVDLGGSLWTIDPNTGEKSLIGQTGLGDQGPVGIAFHPLTDRLLVLQNSSTRLYEVDASTAIATLIGEVGNGVDRGLSFSPAGELFAFQGTGPDLYRIDPATAAGTLVGGPTPFVGIREDSTFTHDGELFVNDFFGNIYRTDPSTGIGEWIGSTGFDDGLLGLLSNDDLTPSNQSPDCSAATPTVSELWPPSHRMVPVSLTGVTDPDGDPIAITITGITQDEPVNGLGDGDTCPDASIGAGGAQVRAERAGPPFVAGNGRVYSISFIAADGRGGSCSGAVEVCVPHDNGRGSHCIDDGQRVNALGPCETPGLFPAPAVRNSKAVWSK